eukprot:175011-Chlamydomonas_euryale.AAC.1
MRWSEDRTAAGAGGAADALPPPRRVLALSHGHCVPWAGAGAAAVAWAPCEVLQVAARLVQQSIPDVRVEVHE